MKRRSRGIDAEIPAEWRGEPAVTGGAVRRDSSCRPDGRGFGVALTLGPILLWFLLLDPFICGSALDNRTCRDLTDLEILRRVRTVCVDTSYLETKIASDVKTFVAKENQPGQLLKQVNWELTDQCAAADAVIRVYFAPSERHVTRTDDYLRGGQTTEEFFEPVTQVVLLVYDRASVRLLYRAEDQGQAISRAALLKGPFSRLAKDMKGHGH